MQRVIAYIDGFNLYYGIRSKGWKWAYWVNLNLLSSYFLRPGQELIDVKYFTSIVNSPLDKHERQKVYIDALRTLTNISVYYGHYLSEQVTCRTCSSTHLTYHEKMTDVNISVELLTDAFTDSYDIAFLLTADSDLVGPVRAIRSLFPKKRVIALFPPGRYSSAIRAAVHGTIRINADSLSECLFSNEVEQENGYILKKPSLWK